MLLTISVKDSLNLTELDMDDIQKSAESLVESYRDGTMDNEGVNLQCITEKHNVFELLSALHDEYIYFLEPGEDLKLYYKYMSATIKTVECQLELKGMPTRRMI